MPQIVVPGLNICVEVNDSSALYLDPAFLSHAQVVSEEPEHSGETWHTDKMGRQSPSRWIRPMPPSGVPIPNCDSVLPSKDISDLFYEILSCAPEHGPNLLRSAHSWSLGLAPGGTAEQLANMNIFASISSAVSQEKGTRFKTLSITALEVMLSEFLCGYDKQTLEACNPDRDVTTVPTWGILKYCLHTLQDTVGMLLDSSSELESGRDPECALTVDHYLRHSPELWGRFWQLRMTILNPQRVPCERSDVYSALVNLASSEVSLHNALRGTIKDVGGSSMLLVLEHIWIHGSYIEERFMALSTLDYTLMELDRITSETYLRFYRTQRNISLDVATACVRDLRDRRSSPNFIYKLLMFAPAVRSINPNSGVSSSMDHKLFRASLAAARTMLCSTGPTASEKVPFPHPGFIFGYIASNWGGEERAHLASLSEEDMYAILCIIPTSILDYLKRGPSRELDELRRVMNTCCRQLEQRVNIRGELSSYRRGQLMAVSQMSWTKSLDLIRRTLPTGPLSAQVTASSTYNAYKRLGVALRLDLKRTVSSVTEVVLPHARRPWHEVERSCNWRECCCSAFQAAHRMKECKGCRKVFYCNADCQTADWKMGNHKAFCVSRT